MSISPPPPANSSSPLASLSSKAEEPRRFNRTANAGFGFRLANARNLAHTDVPLAPPRQENRTASGALSSEVAASARGPGLVPPGAPRYGHEKGSYRSPFEYPIIVGANTTASSALFSSAAPSPSPDFFSFSATPSADPSVPQKMEEKTMAEVDHAVTPGPDAKERLLLLGPLKLIAHTATALRKDDREMLDDFLVKYMAPSLHTIIEVDQTIPSIVYKISVPMTDENWAKYNQLLSVFAQAKGMHEMLAKGPDAFDHYTYQVEPDVTLEEHIEGWRVLSYAHERGFDTETLSQELVGVWKKVWIEGGSGYVGGMPGELNV